MSNQTPEKNKNKIKRGSLYLDRDKKETPERENERQSLRTEIPG